MHFTIDSDNNITAHETAPAVQDGVLVFASEKGLAKASAEWPISRLVEVWNSFAGVAPFDELKPVTKFTDRATAVNRIWQAIQKLASGAQEGAQRRTVERTVHVLIVGHPARLSHGQDGSPR